MKKVLIGLLALASISSFAEESIYCGQVVSLETSKNLVAGFGADPRLVGVVVTIEDEGKARHRVATVSGDAATLVTSAMSNSMEVCFEFRKSSPHRSDMFITVKKP